MRKRIFTASEVKKSVSEMQGKSVNLKIHTGRNRFQEFSGVIDILYPSVFTVKNSECFRSFSYSEVACQDVRITVV